MKRIIPFTFFLFILLFSNCTSPGLISRENPALLFIGDFENEGLYGWGKETCLDCPQAIQLVSSPVRGGKQAVRFELSSHEKETKANGTGSYRSEIKLPPEPSVEGIERWYAFSIFLPEEYEPDPANDVVAQWHGSPDVDEGEEKGASPPMALRTINGEWQITWRWDSRRISEPVSKSEGNEKRMVGPYTRGQWTDWVFHIKRSFQSDGLLEVWQNGVRVLTHTGPNTYNDKKGVYFKTGIYKSVWADIAKSGSTTTRRVLYVDEVRVGNEKATFELVSPSGKK